MADRLINGRFTSLSTGDRLINGRFVDGVGGGDVTAPVLSLPTGIKTGSTTGSGTVTTDEANGTLYYLASTNASETAATIIAASSQAVSTTGSQAVTFTGLTPSTSYFAHYVHVDAALNESNVVSSSPAFTTDAASTFQAAWAKNANVILKRTMI